MTVFDVTDFETMEQFLWEKNHILNCFEDQILQQKSKQFVERELFFLVKDNTLPQDFESLFSRYKNLIEGFYSLHQIPRVAVANSCGDIWVKTYEFCGYSEVFDSSVDRYPKWEPQFQKVYKKFQEAFQLHRDYETLYEDEQIQIIVFLLRLSKTFMDFTTGKLHMEEKGYYVNPNQPCDIIPYDMPYDYSYLVLSYEVLKKIMHPDEFQRMKSYYTYESEEKGRQRKK